MSFESFISDIEEVGMLPTPIKGDGGWYNPEDMQHKLVRTKHTIAYIGESNNDEIQLPLIEAIYKSMESAIIEDVRSAIDLKVDESLCPVWDSIKRTDSRLDESLENTQDPMSIAIVRKLIADQIPKNPTQTADGQPKVKLSTLTMLKEEGYSVMEIAELRDAGLI